MEREQSGIQRTTQNIRIKQQKTRIYAEECNTYEVIMKRSVYVFLHELSTKLTAIFHKEVFQYALVHSHTHRFFILIQHHLNTNFCANQKVRTNHMPQRAYFHFIVVTAAAAAALEYFHSRIQRTISTDHLFMFTQSFSRYVILFSFYHNIHYLVGLILFSAATPSRS